MPIARYLFSRNQNQNQINYFFPHLKSGLGRSYQLLKEHMPNKTKFGQVNIVIGNPDQIIASLSYKNFYRFLRGYNIGVWFWELDKFPLKWFLTKSYIDEIWVYTDYMYQNLKPLNKNIKKIPFLYPEIKFKKKSKQEIGIPTNKFIFLFIFDFNSYFERKNPVALIKAFEKLFYSSNDTSLVIKTINSKYHQKLNLFLKEQAKKCKNIIFLENYLDNDEYYSLIKNCNCYISLHRSEGLGLTMYESMMLGIPVIATNYSGNLEFMNDSNSLLVRYELVDVKNDYLYGKNCKWAEPDIEHAVFQMHKIRYDEKLQKTIADRAKRDIKKMNSKIQHHTLRNCLN